MEKEFLELLSAGEYEQAAEFLNKTDSEEIASIIEKMDDSHVVPFCRSLESDVLAEALVLLPTSVQETIIEGLRDDELAEVFEEVSVDDTVEIIEEMPENLVLRIAEEEEILQLFSQRNFAVLKPLLASMNAVDVAQVFDSMDEDGLAIMFRILPKDLAADTFVAMESETKENLLHKLSDREIKVVMNELFLDDTVDLLEEMPASVVKRLLALSDSETRSSINEILKYPKDSAGSIMTIEYVSLKEDMTVAHTVATLFNQLGDMESIFRFKYLRNLFRIGQVEHDIRKFLYHLSSSLKTILSSITCRARVF